MGSEFLMQGASVCHSATTRAIYIMGVRQGGNDLVVARWAIGAAALEVYMGTGATIFQSLAVAAGVYHFIEIKVKMHASTGYLIIRVDGQELYNSGLINTMVTGTGTGVGDTIWCANRYGSSGGTQNAYYDDFAFCAIDGTAPVASSGDWLGDVREVRLDPNGAGASAQFAPSASTNQSNVDDGALSDDDTTYNYEATVGEKDSFAMTNLASTPLTVLGVRQRIRARKDDVGARGGRQLVRISGTDYEGSDLVLTDGYQTFHRFLPLSPASSAAWTEAEINAIESGYKVQS
jgi:hypothetical protein